MKKFSKYIALILSITLLITPLVGCSSVNNNAVIYYEAQVIPNTIDPQLASNDTELLMIRNLFEGLMRVDQNGEIVPAVAENYTLVDNVYTFTLKETSVWSDGTPVTAYDFEYAFKRAVDPVTRSPYAGKLRTILNAELIMSGNIGVEHLGVKAIDTTTLTISLATNDTDFLYKLTTAVCMPCREDFFVQCEGQYGLLKNKIITNGSYRLTKWNKEDFAVRLYRNDKYYGDFTAKNSAVFISHDYNTENIEKLEDSSVDIAAITNNEIDRAFAAGLKTAQHQNVLWVIEMNNVYSYDLRHSLFLSFDQSNYAGDLSNGFNAAYTFFPNIITSENLDNVGIEEYNINEARTIYNSAISQLPGGRFPNTKLYYYSDPNMKLAISDIVGHWQKQLGAYINTKPIESISDIKNSLKTNECAVAIYPITITDKDPSVLAYSLGYDFSKTSVKKLSDVQKSIISEQKLMPIAFENTVVAYSNHIIDFNYSLGNGLIDFAYVTKK